MFSNFSLPELLIVGALALIVIGPKDLPKMMRQIGKFVGQARGLARQFQDSMNDAAREIELEEFREARKMLNKKADTKALTDPFNKVLEDDDGSNAKAKPRERARALTSEELAQRAEDSGFGAAMKPSKPDALATTSTATADTPKEDVKAG